MSLWQRLRTDVCGRAPCSLVAHNDKKDLLTAFALTVRTTALSQHCIQRAAAAVEASHVLNSIRLLQQLQYTEVTAAVVAILLVAVCQHLVPHNAVAQKPDHNLCIGPKVITVTASVLGNLQYAAGNSSSAVADTTACHTAAIQHYAGGGAAQ
eukprot:18154-Heterococcus_DN1.PRE.6